ncbi:RDD family protein [Streptomyces litchfieldiae]|uniref:RDD family protein n=1 Tax=Streptomyces litchfieldiae TaxID=3075543 RepID=A0ABU2MZ24_9ACTN|nr:RDD family protein [Streptomyces sp. DSM 44938]MDT0346780.1 RDD family protein [Streptomyces sp. DSM 44938]
MSQLVTGDAVVLGLQPARLPSRAMAIAVDLVVVVGVYLLLSVVLLSTVLPLGSAAAGAVQVALLVLVLVGGPIAVETLSRGRSLGKLAFGLRVVRNDGGPIRFRHALVRGAVGFVEIFLTAGSVACIASLVSAEGRRLGDIFAGTLVVRERIPGGRARPLPVPPPEAAGQFTGLDLSRVPDPLWLAVRQYLTRMGQLDPQVAWSMAVRLADDVVARVGTPAPPGMHPAAYLSAVAGERQRREAERAFGPGPAAAAPPAPSIPVSPAPPVPPGPPVAERPERAPEPPPVPREERPAPRGAGFTPPS